MKKISLERSIVIPSGERNWKSMTENYCILLFIFDL